MEYGGRKGAVLKLPALRGILLLLAGCSAGSNFPDTPIRLTETQRAAVKAYIVERKFAPSDEYVGFLSEDVISNPEAPLNELAGTVMTDPPANLRAFAEKAQATMEQYNPADTEDREAAARQLNRLFKIVGAPLRITRKRWWPADFTVSAT